MSKTTTKTKTRNKSWALLSAAGALVVLGAAAVAVHNRPATDPFAGATPRGPCAMRSAHDLAQQERDGTPAPQPQNPSYCQQPVCHGNHTGSLAVRYNNTELLRTGSTTLDIASDDGSPLGVVSVVSDANVRVAPADALYSPDKMTRFTLTGKGAAGADQPYGDGPASSLRQVTYPVSISVKAWCGQHMYNATVKEELKVRDTITGRTYTK